LRLIKRVWSRLVRIILRRPVCACSERYGGSDLLGAFTTVREGCPALKAVFLPDGIWPAFLEAAGKTPDKALHQSMLVLAFQRGHLEVVTEPVHRFLLVDGRMKPDLRKKYAQDLRERWLLETGILERHQESRRFMGPLVELLCARWLERSSWRITGLEAFQEGPDITAEHEAEGAASFEVKSVGQEDSDFQGIVASLHGPPTVDTKDLYAAANYLTFRVYEAAKQLQQFGGRRIVLLVVNEITWHNVEFQLRGNWIDWRSATLFDAKSAPWRTFIDAQREKYPHLDEELAAVIRSVHDIWILKLRYGYELSKEYAFEVAA
jgi:hypothetical protein